MVIIWLRGGKGMTFPFFHAQGHEGKSTMTKLIIHSGACGYTVTIIAEKAQGGKISLTLDTECEMVKKMPVDISVLDQYVPLAGFLTNPVYQSAAKHLRHGACPVPSGILKAIEVEAGLNIPKDVTFSFVKE
ncbi:MAG TPA: hypothetical protein VEI57_07825 [Nitrospirota bacterium]|nr:hypothetical protein [Nitrospirota bacterium]